MKAGLELRLQQPVNETLSLDPTEPDKGIRHDHHRVVSFSPRTGAGMTGMAMGIVDDLETGWRECRPQLRFDPLRSTHG